ncbi:histidine kinase [Colwelliaceae bacterium 6471]
MNNLFKYWPILFFLALPLSLQADERRYEIVDVKANKGDNLEWAKEAIDDSQWQPIEFTLTPNIEGNYWLRLTINITDKLDSAAATELFLHIIGSSEVYWDGRLIGRNGLVGHNKQSETPGQIDTLFLVPYDLYQPGLHTVAIRVSHYYPSLAKSGLRYDFVLGPYGETYSQHTGLALVPIVTLGGTLVIAIYFIFIFALERKNIAFLFFGLTCLGVAGMLVSEAWRGVLGYSYDWHVTRLRAILSFAFVVSLSLPWFVLHYFKLFNYHKYLVGFSVATLILANWNTSFDLRTTILLFLGLSMALMLSLNACYRKHSAARLLASGVLICLAGGLATPFQFIDETFFYLFPVMTMLILVAVAIQNKKHKQERDAALVYSTRLKSELVKKNIQPHFILNTLTSLASWIAIEPKTADKMLNALAQEFRSLMEMSEERLVPLDKELQLCQSHLQVMGYRKDIRFQLNHTELDQCIMLPPGIIHTLIENAISHNRYLNDSVVFDLAIKIEKARVIMVLSVPLGNQLKTAVSSGTGTKYIEARLEEAWPAAWKFKSFSQNDKWLTQIEFPEECQN